MARVVVPCSFSLFSRGSAPSGSRRKRRQDGVASAKGVPIQEMRTGLLTTRLPRPYMGLPAATFRFLNLGSTTTFVMGTGNIYVRLSKHRTLGRWVG